MAAHRDQYDTNSYKSVGQRALEDGTPLDTALSKASDNGEIAIATLTVANELTTSGNSAISKVIFPYQSPISAGFRAARS